MAAAARIHLVLMLLGPLSAALVALYAAGEPGCSLMCNTTLKADVEAAALLSWLVDKAPARLAMPFSCRQSGNVVTV